MSAEPGSWEFFLAASSDLSRIGLLNTTTSRQLTLEFNRPGSFSASVPIDDPIAFFLKNRSTAVVAERNGEVVWSGALTSIVDDAAERTTQIVATGWMEELDHRNVHPADLHPTFLSANGLLQHTGSFLQWASGHPTDADIVSVLIGAANIQVDTTDTARPTHVTSISPVVVPTAGHPVATEGIPGISTTPRTRTYNVGDNYGQSIRELSDIENGCDLILDPATRLLLARDNTAFVNRTNVHFSLGATSTNLVGAVRTADGTRLMNRITVAGSGPGLAVADDVAAIDDAGVMLEEWDSLSDVSDAIILGAYANAELVFKRYGVTTYQVTPMPTGTVPRLFDDFDLGDQVYFSVDAGRFNVSRQAIRVFSATISVDESGNESVGELGVSPSGG